MLTLWFLLYSLSYYLWIKQGLILILYKQTWTNKVMFKAKSSLGSKSGHKDEVQTKVKPWPFEMTVNFYFS